MKKSGLLFVLFTISFFAVAQNNFTPLFNGKDLTNWMMLPGKEPGFEVIDGILVAVPQNGSYLFTEEYYANFIFKFEYLLSKVGNSGVFIRCAPHFTGTGFEVQLLAPWTPYRDDLHCTGSIYGYVAVSDRPDETTGIWHQMEIKCDRKNITISVDGRITTDVDIDTVKSMDQKYFEGAIGFQANHGKIGEYAHFRNVSIKNLDAEPEYVASGFYEKDSRLRTLAHKAALSIGAPIIEQLARMLSEENAIAQSGAKQVLFDIAAQATVPGVEKADKKVVIKALKKSSKQRHSENALEYISWLKNMVESVNK